MARTVIIDDTKDCSICRERFPLSHFYKTPLTISGLASRCKGCDRVAVSASRKKTGNFNRLQTKYRNKLRSEFLAAYGSMCACCDEVRTPFLTLDHINGDGRTHCDGSTTKQLKDLKRRGWPKDDYRILCMNCNFATRFGGTCPHELEKR